METSLRKAQGLAAVMLATVVAGASVSQAVALTNGGMLNSWETGDALAAEGWYTPSWARYTFQNGTADWAASADVATEGTRSLKLVYTPDATGNFNWGSRFESWSLGTFDAPARVAWEAPWREAIADNRDNYSLTFDVIWRAKGAGKDGIPQPPGWGANLSFAMDWGAAEEAGGHSGWTQFDNLGFSNVTQDQVVEVKIPLKDMIGGTNGLPIPANFHWVQLHFGPNGGWAPGEEVAVYFDNLRIVQDVITPPSVPGDADGDGDADLDDIGIWATNFTGSLAPGAGTGTLGMGDFDGDKDVDLDDQGVWASNFTGSLAAAGAAAAVAVPEPACAGVVAMGAFGLFARSRRRAV
jgi:hypothetical protein